MRQTMQAKKPKWKPKSCFPSGVATSYDHAGNDSERGTEADMRQLIGVMANGESEEGRSTWNHRKAVEKTKDKAKKGAAT